MFEGLKFTMKHLHTSKENCLQHAKSYLGSCWDVNSQWTGTVCLSIMSPHSHRCNWNTNPLAAKQSRLHILPPPARMLQHRARCSLMSCSSVCVRETVRLCEITFADRAAKMRINGGIRALDRRTFFFIANYVSGLDQKHINSTYPLLYTVLQSIFICGSSSRHILKTLNKPVW